MKLRSICRYPVKGLSGQIVTSTSLLTSGIPWDRAFAFIFADGDPGGDVVPWLRKSHFATQNDWPGLAALQANFNEHANHLSISHAGQLAVTAPLTTSSCRQPLDDFMSAYIKTLQPHKKAKHPTPDPLRLVGGIGANYADRKQPAVSILGSRSAHALSEALQHDVSVHNFRGNLVIDTNEAWEELRWVGKELQIGAARLRVIEPIIRCPNINVETHTGAMPIDVFAYLAKLNKAVFGVMAEVVVAGEIQTGDEVICT